MVCIARLCGGGASHKMIIERDVDLTFWLLSLPSEYSVSHWNLLPHTSCGGSHQSPVNIETHNVVMDKRLDAVTCTGFDNKSAINSITNTGHTGMKVMILCAGKC